MHRAITLILLWSSILHSSQSQIQLPRLISDGVILQHDEPLNIWGWASPGESVTLKLGDYKYVAQAEDNGEWSVTVPPQEAGGPHELVFTGSSEIIVKDVLFGDVWICSGQSNMELTMERVKEKYPDVISSASNRYIRQFTVPDQYDFKHAHADFDEGSWEDVDSQSILSFSAVAYFFARELHDKYDVPIGLINAAVGGSPVEAWMSEEALKQFPDAYDEMQKFKDDKLIESIESADRKRIGLWHNELNRLDKGLSSSARWYEPYHDDVEWDVMEIPGFWSDHSTDHLNGVFWFRKTFYLPPDIAG
ncbi:MAG: sialate O-acetylesterase, partial [Saprospiraceae bacterium]|nr:sialate O-acetylesterase [Saprospiraceae bacterium]